MPRNLMEQYENIRQELLRSGSPDGITHDRLKDLVVRYLGVIRDNTIERHIHWMRHFGYIAKIQDWPQKLYVALPNGQTTIEDIGNGQPKPNSEGRDHE